MCTDFILPQGTKQRVSGRSMDFGVDLPWVVSGIPAQTTVKAFAYFPDRLPIKSEAFSWKTRYDMVGIGGGINLTEIEDFRNKLVDGINSEGFSAAALWLPTSVYPEPSAAPKGVKLISAVDIVAWALGNYSRVKELRKDLKLIAKGEPIANGEKIAFWDPFQFHSGAVNYVPLHFQFHDKDGHSLVLEFKKGKMQLTKNTKVGVMTNYPFIDWHLTNLENYLAVTNLNVDKGKIVDLELEARGNGNGTLGLSISPTPPSRFVRVAKLISFGAPWLQQLKENEDGKAHAFAFNILGVAEVPRMMVIDGEGKLTGDYTQWTLIRDHKTPQMLLRTADTVGTYQIDFSEMIKDKPHYVKMKEFITSPQVQKNTNAVTVN